MSWESVLPVKQLDVRQEHLWAQSSDACCGRGSWARCRRLQDLAKVWTHPFCLSSSQQSSGSNFSSYSRGVSCIFQFSDDSLCCRVTCSFLGLRRIEASSQAPWLLPSWFCLMKSIWSNIISKQTCKVHFRNVLFIYSIWTMQLFKVFYGFLASCEFSLFL